MVVAVAEEAVPHAADEGLHETVGYVEGVHATDGGWLGGAGGSHFEGEGWGGGGGSVELGRVCARRGVLVGEGWRALALLEKGEYSLEYRRVRLLFV